MAISRFEFDFCTAKHGASSGGMEHCNASARRGICHISFVSTAPDATSESFMAQARLTRAATRANMVGGRARVEMCHSRPQQSERQAARAGDYRCDPQVVWRFQGTTLSTRTSAQHRSRSAPPLAELCSSLCTAQQSQSGTRRCVGRQAALAYESPFIKINRGARETAHRAPPETKTAAWQP